MITYRHFIVNLNVIDFLQYEPQKIHSHTYIIEKCSIIGINRENMIGRFVFIDLGYQICTLLILQSERKVLEIYKKAMLVETDEHVCHVLYSSKIYLN